MPLEFMAPAVLFLLLKVCIFSLTLILEQFSCIKSFQESMRISFSFINKMLKVGLMRTTTTLKYFQYKSKVHPKKMEIQIQLNLVENFTKTLPEKFCHKLFYSVFPLQSSKVLRFFLKVDPRSAVFCGSFFAALFCSLFTRRHFAPIQL